jgi:putative ABC transport system permease protein
MGSLRLLFKNVLRNKRRTLLTVSSIAVSLFLVATLQTVLTELQNPPETPDSALRLITRHQISLFNILPKSQRAEIEEMEGVEAVIGTMWFGGIYKEPSNFFANFATDTDQFFQVYPDLIISKGEQEAFKTDRTGAIVGDNLARRFGWKVGDRIFLKGSTFPVDVELTIRGVYGGGSDLGTSLYFQWEYFSELLNNAGFVGTYTIRARSPEDVPRIAEQVDGAFRNSSYPTKTETERAFILGFVSMLGDVQLFITSIVSAVVFTIILVAANTMAMSIRERVREIGVLKALGFRSSQVLTMLVGESVLLSLVGALLGSWGARLLFGSVDMALLTSGFMQRFYVTPGTLILCLLIGLFVGICSASVPAWRASQRPVVDALRRVA